MNQPTVPTRSENTSSNTLRALPTYYEGVTFRSRLEARWAIVFDHLNIPWEYEKEGYALPSGNYLPDFWLPTIRDGMWFEVKGSRATKAEQWLIAELCEATGHDGTIATGTPNSVRTGQNIKVLWGPSDVFGDPRDPEYYNPESPSKGRYDYDCSDEVNARWDYEDCGGMRRAYYDFQHIYDGHIEFRHTAGSLDPVVFAAYEAGRTARFNNGHHATARSHK